VYLPKEADSTGLVSLDKYVFRFMRSSTNKRDTIILMEKNNVVRGGGEVNNLPKGSAIRRTSLVRLDLGMMVSDHWHYVAI
jgi:hypothetical protein